MKTYNVLIVDDEPEARALLEHYLEQVPSCQLIASCKNASEAFQKISEHTIDLIFLDIHMPEISGVAFAKSIPDTVKIIFTTAHREYALEGFELMAVDYLLKPIPLDRFLKGVYKFLGQSHDGITPETSQTDHFIRDFIFVRSDRKMVKIELKTIKYIESVQDYVKVFLTDQTVITRETISNMQASLAPRQFIRCHRSFIVAIRHIDSFTHEHITIGRNTIPISRGYRDEILQKLKTN
jgi:DNA-binding LytR/AlgR family response regulator